MEENGFFRLNTYSTDAEEMKTVQFVADSMLKGAYFASLGPVGAAPLGGAGTGEGPTSQAGDDSLRVFSDFVNSLGPRDNLQS